MSVGGDACPAGRSDGAAGAQHVLECFEGAKDRRVNGLMALVKDVALVKAGRVFCKLARMCSISFRVLAQLDQCVGDQNADLVCSRALEHAAGGDDATRGKGPRRISPASAAAV
jgi:hypothetical protein